jgi:hypothetical protein
MVGAMEKTEDTPGNINNEEEIEDPEAKIAREAAE